MDVALDLGAADLRAADSRAVIAWRLARRNPMAAIGALVLLTWALIALTVPLWAPYDPNVQDVPHRLMAPSAQHIFGTDLLGRDLFVRVLYGARISLPAAALILAAAMLIGSIYGLISGYVGGIVDEALMRLTDVALAFPGLILSMAIAAALGPSLTHAAIALIVVKWPQFARVMRGQVLAVKELPHVEAARVVGARPARIVFRHILPETLSPILTIGSSVFGNTILSIAGLSFLGLGAVPPSPEWGSMVSDAQSAFGQWWIGTFPGLAIISAVLSASFLGDGIRDVMDPRTRSE